MRLHGLIISFALAPALMLGCIVTKDMEDDDTAGSDSDGSTTDPTTTSGDGPTTTDAVTTTTDPGDSGTSTTSATTGGSDSGTTTDTGSSDGSDSGDTGSGDEMLCESTGGTWDMSACGHYECGIPTDCRAVIPGCDCGATMNFVEGTGCVEDEACAAATFACGPSETCLVATEYCEIFQPGVPGPPSYSCVALPNACVGDATCVCLDAEGIPGPAGSCTPVPGGGLEVEILGA